MKLIEVELYGIPRAQNSYFAWSLCSEYGFSIPKVWNGLFRYFQKSTDLKVEKNVIKGDKNMKFTEVELHGIWSAKILNSTQHLGGEYVFCTLKG